MTHFLKILEIFRIQKFFDELWQNTQFLVKIIFGVTLILYWYRIVLILIKIMVKNSKGRSSIYKCQFLDRKIFGKCSWKLVRQKMTRQRLTHFQFLSIIKMRQSLAKDCIYNFLKNDNLGLKLKTVKFPKFNLHIGKSWRRCPGRRPKKRIRNLTFYLNLIFENLMIKLSRYLILFKSWTWANNIFYIKSSDDEYI